MSPCATAGRRVRLCLTDHAAYSRATVVPLIWRLLAAGLLFGVAGCGGSSPTQPSPTLAANIVTDSMGRFAACIGGGSARTCIFEEGARNAGPGCAVQVRGTVRFLASTGAQIASAEWSLAPARVLAVGEAFVYQATVSSPESQYSLITQYAGQAVWTNTPC